MNRYAYVLNNLMSSIEPNGLQDCQFDGPDCDDIEISDVTVTGDSPLQGCDPSCTDQNGVTYSGTDDGAISGGSTTVQAGNLSGFG
jgi:hypothetical protein